MMLYSPLRLSRSSLVVATLVGFAAALIIFGSSPTRSQAQGGPCWTWAQWTCQGNSACGTTACNTTVCNTLYQGNWTCGTSPGNMMWENVWINPNATANGVKQGPTGSTWYNNSGGGSTDCVVNRQCAYYCQYENDGFYYCQSNVNGATGGICGLANMALIGGTCPPRT